MPSSFNRKQQNVFEYLQSLPQSTLRSLYQNHSYGTYVCRSVLQHLPELAKQFVMRLAVCDGSFSRKQILGVWMKNKEEDGGGESSKDGEADDWLPLGLMECMCVVEPRKRTATEIMVQNENNDDDDEEEEDLCLSPEFKEGIQKSLTSLTSAPWPRVTPTKMAEHSDTSSEHECSRLPTLVELEHYTQKRLESVLHYLVGSTPEENENVEEPPKGIVRFLEKAGLMQKDPEWESEEEEERSGKAPLVITNKGYEFMLLDVRAQVWQIVLQYLNSLPSQHLDGAERIASEAVSLLIGLGYCRVGEAYPADLLSDVAKVLVKDFSQFGLIYLAEVDGKTLFYPTRVAINLVAASSAGTTKGLGFNKNTATSADVASASATRALESALSEPVPQRSHIAIIVQTNFQLCAYTTSQLHLAMLGLFCDVKTFRRLPNIIFYHITRESVKGAFALGITAKQILHFLKMHAHPQLRAANKPLVPPNVEDQIWLWSKERNRVQFEEVYIVQCQSETEHNAIVTYAQDRGALGWSDVNDLRVFVRHSVAEIVISFARQWRSRAIQRSGREAGDRTSPISYV